MIGWGLITARGVLILYFLSFLMRFLYDLRKNRVKLHQGSNRGQREGQSLLLDDFLGSDDHFVVSGLDDLDKVGIEKELDLGVIANVNRVSVLVVEINSNVIFSVLNKMPNILELLLFEAFLVENVLDSSVFPGILSEFLDEDIDDSRGDDMSLDDFDIINSF